MAGPRILIVGNDVGYFLSHRVSLARFLVQAGYDVDVALPLAGSPRLKEHGMTFHDIPLDRGSMNPVRDFATFLALLRLYRRLRPPLVHHFTIKPILYGGIASRIARVKRVVNSFTGLGTIFATNRQSIRVLRTGINTLLKYSCLRANVVNVFQNQEDRARLSDLGIVSKQNSLVVPGSGVNVHLFRPAPESDGVPIVAFPSRLLWDKGLAEFVDAARLIRSRGLTARFVLIGQLDPNPTSVTEDVIRSWVAEGIVEWWGFRQDMPTQLLNVHIVCLPSYHEGLPKSLLEAAACGRPIVTTDVPGCRDVVIHGENGLLVPARNAAAIADAIAGLLTDPERRSSMGRDGRQRAERLFASETISEQFLQLYGSLGA